MKTKLNWKVFTKVIQMPSEGSLGLDRQSVLIRREARALLILWQGVSRIKCECFFKDESREYS
jgi:hypothetical protein